jgi:phosphatidylserine/phosphatidylglycerophosphate/cardiolipin synthase-like enzyme
MKVRKCLHVFIISLSAIITGCCGNTQVKSNSPQSEVYFSPGGHTQNRIIEAIDDSGSSIDLAIYSFTSQEIKSAFEKAKQRGVKIRIIADSSQAKGTHSVIPKLINEGFNVKITHGLNRGIMHNKFAIFDKRLLFLGSYNWTNNAEHYNYENAVFITAPETITQYQKEFDKILTTAPDTPTSNSQEE